jgi:hypothetical protein
VDRATHRMDVSLTPTATSAEPLHAILSNMQAFDELQGRLGEVLAANQAGSSVDHVLIALPSFSVGESLLSHYVDVDGTLTGV